MIVYAKKAVTEPSTEEESMPFKSHCMLCGAKFHTEEQLETHVQEAHEIDMIYKST